MRYVQAISAGRAECSSTRYVSDTSEWSQISRHGIVMNFVAQYCNLILYVLQDSNPLKADECVGDVVGALTHSVTCNESASTAAGGHEPYT